MQAKTFRIDLIDQAQIPVPLALDNLMDANAGWDCEGSMSYRDTSNHSFVPNPSFFVHGFGCQGLFAVYRLVDAQPIPCPSYPKIL
jgi:D-arabinose 1-dehydrogenase-like Zn-dependent alcohol dehydrogenase